MIFRLGATAAAFGAGGVIAGVTTSLAVYTILREVGEGVRHKAQDLSAPRMAPSPYTPPAASAAAGETGPNTSGAMSGMR